MMSFITLLMGCKKKIVMDSFCNWAKSPIVSVNETKEVSRIYKERIALYEYKFNEKCQ